MLKADLQSHQTKDERRGPEEERRLKKRKYNSPAAFDKLFERKFLINLRSVSFVDFQKHRRNSRQLGETEAKRTKIRRKENGVSSEKMAHAVIPKE